MSAGNLHVGEDEVQAFIDERLGEPHRAAIEEHLTRHPQLRERVQAERRQRAALRAQLAGKAAEAIPTRLRIASIQASQRARLRRRMAVAAAGLLIFIVGAGTGWMANDRRPSVTLAMAAPTAAVVQGANAAYRTFVVEVAHPVEVGVAQEGHLLQWLSKRLGRKLVSPDLTPFGYRLIGGRLLPGGSGAAAQLMYEDTAGKRLTLYVRAAEGTETAFRFQREGDAATFAWIDEGFGFAVTSAISRDELLPIAEAIYKGLTSKG